MRSCQFNHMVRAWASEHEQKQKCIVLAAHTSYTCLCASTLCTTHFPTITSIVVITYHKMSNFISAGAHKFVIYLLKTIKITETKNNKVNRIAWLIHSYIHSKRPQNNFQMKVIYSVRLWYLSPIGFIYFCFFLCFYLFMDLCDLSKWNQNRFEAGGYCHTDIIPMFYYTHVWGTYTFYLYFLCNEINITVVFSVDLFTNVIFNWHHSSLFILNKYRKTNFAQF